MFNVVVRRDPPFLNLAFIRKSDLRAGDQLPSDSVVGNLGQGFTASSDRVRELERGTETIS